MNPAGDVVVRRAVLESCDDGGPRSRRQGGERRAIASPGLQAEHTVEGIRRRAVLDTAEIHALGFARRAAQLVANQVDEDAPEVVLERGALANREVPVAAQRADERQLDEVVGVGARPDGARHSRASPAAERWQLATKESVERPRVTGLCAAEDRALRGGLLSIRRMQHVASVVTARGLSELMRQRRPPRAPVSAFEYARRIPASRPLS